MDLITIIYFSIILFLVSIPYEYFFPWVRAKIQHINSQLILPQENFYISKAPFIYGLTLLINFAKGFLPLFIYQIFFINEYYLGLLAILILILNNWSVWHKFENRHKFGITLWGVYTFMFPPCFIIFPLGFIFFSVLLNSFILGYLSNLIFMSLVLWVFGTSPLFVMINCLIFLLILFAFRDKIFSHLEEEPITIKYSFFNRMI